MFSRSKFGLYQVDFEDPKRSRRPRASAEYYKRVIKHHSCDIDGDNKIVDELYCMFHFIKICFSLCFIISLCSIFYFYARYKYSFLG